MIALKGVLDRNDLTKFSRKSYRDGYLQSKVRGMIAYQIQALRKRTGLSQAYFAKKIGKTQSVVSRLEDTEYGRVTVQTLLDIACALDVALVVKFASYPDFLAQTSDASPASVQPATIEQSLSERRSTQRLGGSAYRYFLEHQGSQDGATAQNYVANDNPNEQIGGAAAVVYQHATPPLGQLSQAGAA
jgi:transcriptional regulator with XRE-family HTH domain